MGRVWRRLCDFTRDNVLAVLAGTAGVFAYTALAWDAGRLIAGWIGG